MIDTPEDDYSDLVQLLRAYAESASDEYGSFLATSAAAEIAALKARVEGLERKMNYWRDKAKEALR